MTETFWYIAGIIFIALGIAFSIALHELGHLIPAKKFGVKVTKYMIGFGPTLISRKRGETEYGIKLIPLGGYIAMIGMYPPAKDGKLAKPGFFGDMINAARTAHSEQIGPGDENRNFYQLPVYKRIVVMLGGPLMNLFLGVVLMLLALSGIGSPQLSTTIDAVSECARTSVAQTECGPDDAPSPAKSAGLLAGDKVIGANSQPISDWTQVASILESNPTAPLQLTVLRGQTELDVSVTPVTVESYSIDQGTGRIAVDDNGEPILVQRAILGIFLKPALTPQPPLVALEASGQTLNELGGLIFALPTQVVKVVNSTIGLEERDPNGLISIVGVGQIAGEIAASEGGGLPEKLASGLLMLASLNFALFVFNMLPLLPLDGGHVAGGVYEVIKRSISKLLRRPDPGSADTALLMPLTWVVFIALISLSLLLIISDIVNPINLFG